MQYDPRIYISNTSLRYIDDTSVRSLNEYNDVIWSPVFHERFGLF